MEKPSYDKLYIFYRAVAALTVDHEVLGDHAVVYPDKLGDELEKVDPKWYYENTQD